MKYSLTVHQEIPSQNRTSREHWSARARQVRAWTKIFAEHIALRQVPKAVSPRRIVITSFRKRRITDAANLVGGAKSCIDGMVHAGVLVNDSDTWASITYCQDLARNSKSCQPCTVIDIEDAGEDMPAPSCAHEAAADAESR